MNNSFEILSFLSFFVALNHVVSAKIIDDGLEVAGGTKSIYFHLLLWWWWVSPFYSTRLYYWVAKVQSINCNQRILITTFRKNVAFPTIAGSLTQKCTESPKHYQVLLNQIRNNFGTTYFSTLMPSYSFWGVTDELSIQAETLRPNLYFYTTIWIHTCTLGVTISSITPKPYILEKILFLWISCKCLAW